jgi:methyl-accepting chemotaxis protein
VTQAESASQSLHKITDAVQTILETTGVIARSAQTQQTSTDQTSKEVRSVQQIKAAMKQLTDEQAAAAERLKQSSDKLVSLTDRIKFR